jgi:4-hydroxy-2-oxoheptanedioate aldolase
MAALTLAETLRGGAPLYTAWVAMPEPLMAELAGRSGFDAVTLDMQHGLHDPVSVMRGIGATRLSGKPAMVRIPVGDFAMASRALDMGAEGIIAPMINTVADAEAFVAATKYPPLGERSWGPTRTLTLFGISEMQSYLDIANRSTLAIAMIETRTAMAALDDILAVPGLDGVFVGPSDLSVTLSEGKRIAPFDDFLEAPVRTIVEKAAKAGKIAGVFAANAARVRYFRELGYRLIAIGSDQIYYMAGAKALLAESRGDG